MFCVKGEYASLPDILPVPAKRNVPKHIVSLSQTDCLSTALSPSSGGSVEQSHGAIDRLLPILHFSQSPASHSSVTPCAPNLLQMFGNDGVGVPAQTRLPVPPSISAAFEVPEMKRATASSHLVLP